MLKHPLESLALIRRKQDREPYRLCQTCQEHDIAVHFVQRRAKPRKIAKFPISDIKNRLDCPFCRVLFHLLEGAAGIEPERTGHCGLQLPPSKFPEVLVDVPVLRVYGLRIYIDDITPMDIPAEGWEHYSGPQIMIPRLRESISACSEKHVRCNLLLDDFESTDHPTMFVDVEMKCLVELDVSTTYIALSYTWGQVDTLMTSKENLAELKMAGALDHRWAEIALTVSDAILLAHELGFKYLWVDTLCIIQNDLALKEEQIKNMNLIFGRASLTVVAISGHDANYGLPGVRAGTRPIKYAPVSEEKTLVGEVATYRPILKASAYETRGWTFQERALSRRCLYVSNWGWALACLGSETRDIVVEHEMRSWEGALSLIDSGDNDLLYLLYSTNEDYITDDWPFTIYCALAEKYCSRQLTNAKDREDAFIGINSTLTSKLGLARSGIHTKTLVLQYALLWLGRPSQTRSRNPAFPSWSWAGWNGSISYELANHFYRQIRGAGDDDIDLWFSCRADVFMPSDAGEGLRNVLYVWEVLISPAKLLHGGPGNILERAIGDENTAREYAGVLFDTTLPDEPRWSSCYLLGIARAGEAIGSFILDGYSEQVFDGLQPDEVSRYKAVISKHKHILVMLVEEKGKVFERLGIGQIREELWRGGQNVSLKELLIA